MTDFLHGRIEVITGCMFSGKSEELMRRLRRAAIAKEDVQLYKPDMSQWWGGEAKVSTHAHQEMPAIAIKSPSDIFDHAWKRTTLGEEIVIGIDEAQFFDIDLVNVCTQLANSEHRVIVAALATDFRRKPFDPIPSLLCQADQIDMLTAVCTVCGKAAVYTQRLTDSKEQVLVGAEAIYTARCRRHHEWKP